MLVVMYNISYKNLASRALSFPRFLFAITHFSPRCLVFGTSQLSGVRLQKPAAPCGARPPLSLPLRAPRLATRPRRVSAARTFQSFSPMLDRVLLPHDSGRGGHAAHGRDKSWRHAVRRFGTGVGGAVRVGRSGSGRLPGRGCKRDGVASMASGAVGGRAATLVRVSPPRSP